jgi:glycosyltransferase involved in cell wall biosynthesis
MAEISKYIFLSWHSPDYSRSGVKYRGMRAVKLDVEFVTVPGSGLKATKFLFKLKRNDSKKCVYIVASPCHLLVVISKVVGLKNVVLDAGWPLSDSSKIRNSSRSYLNRILLNLKPKIVDFLSFALADLIFLESDQQLLRRRLLLQSRNVKYKTSYTGFNELASVESLESGTVSEAVQNVLQRKYALFRGSYNVEANLEMLTSVFERVKEKGILLVIATNKMPEHLLDRSNVIYIVGHRSLHELKLLFEHSMFVLGQFGETSRTEFTIPHKFFEASYYGKGYISPRTRALNEVLPENVGIYVKNFSSKALEEAIEWIISHDLEMKEKENLSKENYRSKLSQEIVTYDFIFDITKHFS